MRGVIFHFAILFTLFMTFFTLVVSGTDDWEYQWEDEEVTEDIRIPSASLNGDFDDDDDEESAKSSLLNGGQVTV